MGISLGRKSHFSPPGGEVWKRLSYRVSACLSRLGIVSSWRRTYFQHSWLSSRTYAHGAAFSVMCSSHTREIQPDRLLTGLPPASRDSERLDPFCSLLWRGHRTLNPHSQFSPAFAPGRYGWTLHHHTSATISKYQKIMRNCLFYNCLLCVLCYQDISKDNYYLCF